MKTTYTVGLAKGIVLANILDEFKMLKHVEPSDSANRVEQKQE